MGLNIRWFMKSPILMPPSSGLTGYSYDIEDVSHLTSVPNTISKNQLCRIFAFSNLDYNWANLISVSMGGATGLFLGASILSFVEIIYYFFVRPLSDKTSSKLRRNYTSDYYKIFVKYKRSPILTKVDGY